MSIETLRLVLTPISVKDSDALYEILQDSEIRVPYALFSEKHFSKDTIKGFTTLADAFNQAQKATMFVVREKGNDKVIGYIGLGESDPETRPGQWEIGYFLKRDCQGKGLVSEMVSPVLEHAQYQFGINQFFAHVIPENLASYKILAKNGFEVAGTTKDWTPLILDADGNMATDPDVRKTMTILERISPKNQ